MAHNVGGSFPLAAQKKKKILRRYCNDIVDICARDGDADIVVIPTASQPVEAPSANANPSIAGDVPASLHGIFAADFL